jgi:hypothetical protein
MILARDVHPDAVDCLAALVAVALGGLVAGFGALRRGVLGEGRAATLGMLAWEAVTLAFALAWHPSSFAIAWILFALPVAAFGMGMGVLAYWTVRPCLRIF